MYINKCFNVNIILLNLLKYMKLYKSLANPETVLTISHHTLTRKRIFPFLKCYFNKIIFRV